MSRVSTVADLVHDRAERAPDIVAFRFLGAQHIMHPKVPGVGTATAKNFVYHKNAIGHAIDNAGIKTDIGYNGEHDYSYARHTVYHGAKVLQNSGIIEVTTDDTAACELIGQPVELVDSTAPNPKVTAPSDLPYIDLLLRQGG